MNNRRSLLALSLATALSLMPFAVAFAQTAPPPPPPPKQEGTAELAFVGTTGNASTNTFSAGATHIARPGLWTITNRVLAVRTSAEGTVTADSLLYRIRAERALNARVSFFGDYGYYQNEPAGVLHQNDVLGGLVFKVATGPRHTLSVDAGAGYLNEHRVGGGDVSSATYAGGAAYKLKISETAALTEDVRLLGTFDNSDDWRAANAIALTAQLTTHLSLKVSNVVRYANFPPFGFKKTDTTTSVALVASFKRP